MSTTPRLRFGDFEADVAAGELRRGGQRVPLQDLPFRLLTALLERPGDVITRTELGQTLWPSGTFVDSDAGLNTAVGKLREALADDPDSPIFIETVPKRGYRFVGRVEAATTPEEERSRHAPERRWRWRAAAAFIVVGIAAAGTAAYRFALDAQPRRVAVVLFDNETGDAALDQVSQTLTDSLVARLTSRPHLDVIGNAAILRTARPFRDLERIGRELEADFVIIGQVQRSDGARRVLAHLIRVRDQAHVWAEPMPFQASDSEFESTIVDRIAAAVAIHVPAPR